MISKYKNIKRQVSLHLNNRKGWKTNKKIVVIESDDWGSNRMPSIKAFNELESYGAQVKKCPFMSNDSIASKEDLEILFESLAKYTSKDHSSKPLFTFNAIMANPDFDRIEKNNFENYFFEPFTETSERTFNGFDVSSYWQEGKKEGYMEVEFHGREHIQISRWMKLLQDKESLIRKAFALQVYGVSTNVSSSIPKSLLAAFDSDSLEEVSLCKEILKEGVHMFRDLLGVNPSSFIAPNYIYSSSLESTLDQLGIRSIQTNGVQQLPFIEKSKGEKNIKRNTGDKIKEGLLFTKRNCSFEPVLNKNQNTVSKCLQEIEIAFSCRRPAIINSHRLNYIGRINKSNREFGIKALNLLLSAIVDKWEDVVFMSSRELEKEISDD